MKSLVLATILLPAIMVSVTGHSQAPTNDPSDGDTEPDHRPNIIVLLCDDLGYGDLQCFGHPHIKTPHLDALAAGGIRWTHCYAAAPVCSPSRVGLLTGRSPNRAGVYDWIPPAVSPIKSANNKAKTIDNHRSLVHLRVDEITIATVLKDAGYRTAMAGKYHCNSRFNSNIQPGPGDHGFEHWCGTQNNASPSHAYPANFVRNGVPVGKVDEFSCQFVVNEAISFIKQDDSRPYFVYIPFHEPHEPVESPPALVDQYKDVASTVDEAEFFANVTNVDLAVGRLIQFLSQRGDLENTMVVFTSDNGPETLDRYRSANRSFGRTGPLRGMKLWTTEGGVRVPGIMHWPAKIEAGQTLDQAVSSLDLLPTLVALADAKLPDLPLDGIDLTPLVTRGTEVDRTKPLTWTYFNALNERRVAIRSGPYKVLAKIDGLARLTNLTDAIKADIETRNLTDVEIYDVTNDINETENLVGKIDASDRLVRQIKECYHALLHDSPVW